jgi:hypothetical protein
MFEDYTPETDEAQRATLALDRVDRYHRAAITAVHLLSTWPVGQRSTERYEHRWCEAAGYLAEARHWLEAALVLVRRGDEVARLRLQFAALDPLAAELEGCGAPGAEAAAASVAGLAGELRGVDAAVRAR